MRIYEQQIGEIINENFRWIFGDKVSWKRTIASQNDILLFFFYWFRAKKN